MAARSYNAIGKQLARIPKYAQMAEKNPAGFSALVQRMADKMTAPGAPQLRPQFAENADDPRQADRMPAIAPKHGTVEDGFVFLGGDPSKRKNWIRKGGKK